MVQSGKEKLLELEKELSKWRKSKDRNRGMGTPEHIKKEAVELLSEYSGSDLQKKLGINVNALKSWQNQYKESGQFFIPLASESEKNVIISSEELFLKISRGE